MTAAFNTIGLIGKYADPGVSETVIRVGEYLSRKHRVLLDENTALIVTGHELETASREAIGEQCDLVVIVGGDGTLLNAARSLADYDVPLLGVNLGRLGFLVDISPTDMLERLDEILKGHFQEEHRILLHAAIERDGACVGESDAFNDVVVHKWDIARMIEIETYIDGRLLHTIRADGLIVSTPTGSTAYALSGGGPILQPTLDAMVLVPISPHTLSNRPIVIDGNSEIELYVCEMQHCQAQVTCDGQMNLGLVGGDQVRIARKEKVVRLIHPATHDYFESLRAKLHWGGPVHKRLTQGS
jgi:NAD+ kinase